MHLVLSLLVLYNIPLALLVVVLPQDEPCFKVPRLHKAELRIGSHLWVSLGVKAGFIFVVTLTSSRQWEY